MYGIFYQHVQPESCHVSMDSIVLCVYNIECFVFVKDSLVFLNRQSNLTLLFTLIVVSTVRLTKQVFLPFSKMPGLVYSQNTTSQTLKTRSLGELEFRHIC